MKNYILLFGCFFLVFCTLSAKYTHAGPVVDAVIRIIKEQPESITAWQGKRLYVNVNRLGFTKKGVFLQKGKSEIPVPSFGIDQEGIFIPCSQEEAQEHLDKATSALIEDLAHSMGMGASIVEIPPLGIYEGYKAV